MQDINWIQVGAGFLSGGACGAFIKQYFDNRRNRIQPIVHSIEVRSVYDSGENKLFESKIILTGESGKQEFSKLYSGTIEVLNSGLHDYSEFNFGITSREDIKFIQIRPKTGDRHHVSTLDATPSLESQLSSFDISLKPFNRKDSYRFDVLLTSGKAIVSNNDIKISSSHPIKWVQSSPSLLSTVIAEAVLSSSILGVSSILASAIVGSASISPRKSRDE